MKKSNFFTLIFFEKKSRISISKSRVKYCRQRFGYWRSGGFFAQKLNRITAVQPCTNVQSKNVSRHYANTLLAVRPSVLSLFVCSLSCLCVLGLVALLQFCVWHCALGKTANVLPNALAILHF